MAHTATDDISHKQYRLKTWVPVAIGLLLVLASVAVVAYWISHQPLRKPRPAVTPLPFVTVSAVDISDYPVIISANGFVSAQRTATVTPQVSGKITHISPKLLVGEHIKKGELLLQLDKTNYQAALAAANNSLSSAQSVYQQAQGRTRQAARDIKRLGVKPTPLSLHKPQLAAAQSAVKNAKAQVSLAKANLSRTTISAPFNAVVQSTNASIGDIANVGSRLATLAATDTYSVKLLLKSQQLPLLRIGSKVTLTDHVNDTTFDGIINRLDAGFDKNNRTIGAYVDIAQPLLKTPPLLLNSYLHASITGITIQNSAWIANSSIVDNQFVWNMDENHVITPVNITVVHRGHDTSLVRFSDTVNRIVLQPQNSFVAGQKVTTDKSIPSQRNAKNKHTEAQQ